jgi:glycosyltransferase involved in cell wall biosynthesis
MIAPRRRPTIVVPCYNEEHRIDESEFARLSKSGLVNLLFVDDGSSDDTLSILGRLSDLSDAVDVLPLAQNAGKGEAVRLGLLRALGNGARTVGYYDADMATPTEELLRLVSIINADPTISVVLGSRISMLGTQIRRTPARHYLGRLYATVASFSLGFSIYDTQCGAKLFRSSPELASALAAPFRSNWAFDVQLLDRLVHGDATTAGLPLGSFQEVPLLSWRDVRGSKISARHAVWALLDVVALGVRRRHRPGPRVR